MKLKNLFLAGGFLSLLIVYQNCAQEGDYKTVASASSAGSSCTFNGELLTAGQTVTAYLSSTVSVGNTCQSQILTCTGGALTGGSYTYSSCTGASAACSFNGQVYSNGQTVSAYAAPKVSASQTCTAEVLTCNNGSFTTSDGTSINNYPYASCAACGTGGNAVMVGGSPVNACFYLAGNNSGNGVSCDTACANHGLYSALTETLIGFDGTTPQTANCQAVVQQMKNTNFNANNSNGNNSCGNVGLGCVGTSEAVVSGNGQNIPVWDVCNGAATTSSAAETYFTRVCACNN